MVSRESKVVGNFFHFSFRHEKLQWLFFLILIMSFLFLDISSNPPVQSYTPLFISKWIDYSNKYGFGYQLSDHSVGVFFNDLTRISISTDKR